MNGEVHIDVTIVAVAATLCGLFMTRVRQPAIVGYILAGVILGPSGLGLVANPRSRFWPSLASSCCFISWAWSCLPRFRHLAAPSSPRGADRRGGGPDVHRRAVELATSYAVLFGYVLLLSSTAVADQASGGHRRTRTRVGRISVGDRPGRRSSMLLVNGFAGGVPADGRGAGGDRDRRPDRGDPVPDPAREVLLPFPTISGPPGPQRRCRDDPVLRRWRRVPA